MKARSRCAPLIGVAASLWFAASPALADEDLARRIFALRVLIDPESRPLPPLDPTAPDACAQGTWWRSSSYTLRSRTNSAIRDAAIRFRVDAELIRSVIREESAYDPNAVSHRGAMGLMQLMPATAHDLGVVCAFDPRQNVLGGTRYLRELHDRFESWPSAIAAYHAGPQRVASARIPTETRGYVARVLRGWKPATLRYCAFCR